MSELESYHPLIRSLVYAGVVVVSIAWLITIAWVVTRDDLPANERILWLLVVILVPVFGILLYWTFCPQRKLRAFFKYWLPVLVWMAVIFTASADSKSFEHSSRLLAPLLQWLFPQMSQDTVHLIVFLARKCAHLAEYAVFALLVWRALNRSKNNLTPWSWPKVSGTLLIVFLYAASDEFHQIFVPTRTPAIHDVVIDTIGGAAALLAFWLVGHWRKRW
jgi:VanZ family protein